ncbi:MAG TPA: hypothetical protein VFR97_04805 [Capillimicrobium sp.]|nr:hypothetical protein [Capillimicrobium sp.]
MPIHRPVTTLAATALTAVAVALPATATAKPVAYEGRTSSGTVTFDRSGDTVSNLRGLVFVACASTKTSDTKAGAELFDPPGTVAMGHEVELEAEGDSAVASHRVTKTYRMTLTPGRRGVVRGELHLTFMLFEPMFDVFGTIDTNTFLCGGEAAFKAKPVARKR